MKKKELKEKHFHWFDMDYYDLNSNAINYNKNRKLNKSKNGEIRFIKTKLLCGYVDRCSDDALMR